MLHSETTKSANPGKRFVFKTILSLVLIAGFLLMIQWVDFDGFFKSLPFSDAPNAGWMNGKLAYLLFGSIVVCIGCPRQVVSFFAAYFFGLWTGFIIGLTATTIGCALSFFVARIFQNTFKNLVRGRLNLALQFWKDNTFSVTLIWRFIPAGSNLLTNLAAGALGISALPFIAGSALGYIPHTLVFALLGSGIDLGSDKQLYLSLGLFAICILIGVILFSRYKRQLQAEKSADT